MHYYLAYGSNLNLEQMAYRCPSARPYGCGFLKDYRLIFRQYVTIEPSNGDMVPFAIWEIDEECEKALDIYEGFPCLYRKEYLEVDVKGRRIEAMVYIENESMRQYCLPGAMYYAIVMQGYDDVGLDKTYLEIARENTLKLCC